MNPVPHDQLQVGKRYIISYYDPSGFDPRLFKDNPRQYVGIVSQKNGTSDIKFVTERRITGAPMYHPQGKESKIVLGIYFKNIIPDHRIVLTFYELIQYMHYKILSQILKQVVDDTFTHRLMEAPKTINADPTDATIVYAYPFQIPC